MVWLCSSTRKLTLIIGLMFLVVRSVQAASVIDISFLNQDPNFGNILGLAYNAGTDQFYLSQSAHNPPARGLIYTMGSNGSILTQWDINNLVPNSNPSGLIAVGSISYDTSSNHLFIGGAYQQSSGGYEHHLFETSIDGATLFSDIAPLDISNHVGESRIWESIFHLDTINRYRRTGQFVDSIDISKLFPGFPGPGDLTASFSGGLFIEDHFREGIIEIDQNGNGLRFISTKTLGDGRPLAIASDINSNRLFLQINNEELYTLTESDLTAMEAPFPAVPIPSAFLLFLSGILGFISLLGSPLGET